MMKLRSLFLALVLACSGLTVHATVARTTASISAQNTFATQVVIGGPFNVSISGTWAGTVTLQRSFDGGSTWLDVATYTANIEDKGVENESGVVYRIGIKTGQYTSGTAVLRISQ